MCSKDKRGGGKHVKQYLFIQRREARGNFHSKSRPALILVRQPPFPASPQTPQKEKCAHAAEKKNWESRALFHVRVHMQAWIQHCHKKRVQSVEIAQV